MKDKIKKRLWFTTFREEYWKNSIIGPYHSDHHNSNINENEEQGHGAQSTKSVS